MAAKAGEMTAEYETLMRGAFGEKWKQWHPRVKAWAERMAVARREMAA
jgi:hypothetical protein